MIAVSAMACQFALLRVTMPVAPSTAVMTGNLTKAVLSSLNTISRSPLSDASDTTSFLSFLQKFLRNAVEPLERFRRADDELQGKADAAWQRRRLKRDDPLSGDVAQGLLQERL